jgi:thiol-disulfide isomerase/thioredoxin
MKTAFGLVAALTMASVAMAAEVGKPAPDFTGTDINGKTIRLSDYKGKIVVIESYNSDCPFCHNHYATGAAQELQRDLAAKGVVWLMINSVNPKNMSHRTPEQARAEWTAENIAATAWHHRPSLRYENHTGYVRHQQGRHPGLSRRDRQPARSLP